jgi:hypothetical protein
LQVICRDQIEWDCVPKKPLTEAAIRWRSQFVPQPTRGFCGFHRIDPLYHALMNAITGSAFECSGVKAGPAGVICANIVNALHFEHGGL